MRGALPAFGLALLACAATASAGVNTWTVVGPEGGHARSVAFHPAQQNVVLMSADSSLYRSTDLGQSWTVVRDDVAGGFSRILFDTTNPNRVLALGGAGLYRSADGGQEFSRIDAPANLHTLAIARDGTLYAATYEGGILKSGDFGDEWADSSTGLPVGESVVQDLEPDPQDADVLYAVVQLHGLYKSVDAGAEWTRVNTFPGMAALNVAVDPGISAELLLASNQGLWASHDGGVTWEVERASSFAWVGYLPSVFIGGAVAVPLGEGRAIRRAGRGLAWVDGQAFKLRGVDDAAFDPHDLNSIASTLLLATLEGPLLTLDGAMTFELRAHGLRGGTVLDIAVSNGPNGAVYAAFMSGPNGVYRRSGASWLPVDNEELRARVTEPWLPFALAVAQGQPETLFVASGTSLVSSLDGGLTWSPPQPEFAAGKVPLSIAFAPSNPQVLYVGTASQGIYRSDDQGVTWAPRSTGLLAGREVRNIAVDPTNDGVAYASVDPLPPADNFFKTTDGGVGWLPSGGNNLGSAGHVIVDPTNPAVLYATGGGFNQGLFKSVDGAQSWSRVGGQQGHGPVVDVVVDPVVPTTIFLSGSPAGRGASRSVDGGTLWEDLDFISPAGVMPMRSLVLDPLRPHVAIAAIADHGLIEIEIAPDLEVSIVSMPAVVPLGGAATATVRVSNHGPYAASAVELTLGVPADVATLAPLPGMSCTPAGAAMRCSLGAMRVSGFIDTTVTLTGASASAGGTLVASVAAHEPDPAQGNNAASAAVAVDRVADLSVSLVDAADPVTSGGAVQYSASVANAGPNDVPAVSFVLELAGVTPSSASASQGTCDVAAPVVTCELGAVAVNGGATVTIAAVAGAAGTATASASVAFEGVDTVAANDSAVQLTTLSAPQPEGGGSGNGGSGSSGSGGSAGSGGGGGRFGLLELCVMLLMLAGAGRRRRAR